MLAKIPSCDQSKRCDELATVAEPGRFYEAHVFVSMGGYFRSSSVEGSLLALLSCSGRRGLVPNAKSRVL